MRINIYTGDGVLQRTRTSPGGTVVDFIQLLTDPSVANDAATKRSTDLRFSELNAATLTSGVMGAANLPSMTGDAVSVDGTNVVNLRPVVGAGSYANVSVNEKGLVTGSTPLTSDDLPNLSWSTIASDLPTTPAGYGITDAISGAGGVINVNLTLSDAPVQGVHAATKQYVDTTAATGGGGGVAVGDIMLKMVSTTPAGFLRCNGSMVDKVTYADLYAQLVDAYDNRIVTGAGKPWAQQYNINIDNGLGFASSSNGTTLSGSVAMGEVVVTRNRAFILGGSNGTNVSAIQSATIAEDGTVGTWSNIALTLPAGMRNFQAVVTRNFLYVLSGVGAGNSTNFIYRSPIDANGNLGAWQTDGVLPAGLSGHQVFLTSSRIYIIGGSTDGGTTAVDTVYYANVNTDGSLGSWVIGPVLPLSLQHTRLAVTKGMVYVLGGHTGSVVVPNLIFGIIDENGFLTNWTPSSVMPVSIAMGQVLVTSAFVYYMGGTVNNDLSGVSSNIFRAPVNTDGTIGAWSIVTGTCPVKGGHLVSIRSRVCVFGGMNAAGGFLNTSLRYISTNQGVTNDFSLYYTNVVFSPSTATEFRLPDLSFPQDVNGVFYIKF